MIDVPEFFVERPARGQGHQARAWPAGLPDLVAEYTSRRRLTLTTSTPWHGYAGAVVPCTRADGSDAVLELGFVGPETRDEPRALSARAGDTEDFGWPAVQAIAPWALRASVVG